MSDPTAVFDSGKTWALLQVREAKFLVMLRDPVPLDGVLCSSSLPMLDCSFLFFDLSTKCEGSVQFPFPFVLRVYGKNWESTVPQAYPTSRGIQ